MARSDANVRGGGGDAESSVVSEQMIESTGGHSPSSTLELARITRTFELKTTDVSTQYVDVKTARSLLPEPAVPAPDPKQLVIPPEKIRQLVRRPTPRMQRPPMQKLEILQPSASPEPSPSRPASSPESASKVKDGNKAKGARVAGDKHERAEEKSQNFIQKKDQRGDEGRGVSGALEENPYRWVVSEVNDLVGVGVGV